MIATLELEFADGLEQVLKSRKSIRAFRSDPVPEQLIDRALELARWSPSNCNTQPWRVHLVGGEAAERLRGELLADHAAGKMAPEIPYLMNQYPPDFQRRQIAHVMCQQTALGIAREDTEARAKLSRGNMAFWNAPHVAFLFMPAFGNEREAADVGAFGQSLMLACEALGFGSCPQTSLGMMASTIKRVLGVGDDVKLLYGLAIGYPDEGRPAARLEQERLPLEQFVTRHA